MMSDIRDLGFVSWKDKYAKYEDMTSELFKQTINEENKLYSEKIKSIKQSAVNSWKDEFNALPKTYDVLFSYHWLKYQIDVSPDNRYIPTLVISVKNSKQHTFKDVTKYGNTTSLFWIISDSSEGTEDQSLFIYDEQFNCIKEIKHVGDSASSTDNEIYYLEAKDIFWCNKVYKINNKLQVTKLYEEKVEKYSLSIEKPQYQTDIFILRKSAIYQDLAIITKENKLRWSAKGFGTKLPITSNATAFNTFFIDNEKKIAYPKNLYLERCFKINSDLYFIFTNDVNNSLYFYDQHKNVWLQIIEPQVCEIKLIETTDFITVGYPNAPDKVYKLDGKKLTLIKSYKGPIFNIESGKSDRQVPWYAVSNEKKEISKKGLVVYGYGSYGLSLRKNQQRLWIPWINKGYTVAFLGIRGGRENGDNWWDMSRTSERRINGLEDFVNGTRYLQKKLSYTAKNTIIFGRSAGGFLVTAVSKYLLNDIAVIYGAKPYTDYLRTASDKKAPQTVQETDEFGLVDNPLDFYEVSKISPQENIVKNPKHNPAILLTGGIKDSEVSCYMPVKYIKALKEANWKNTYVRVDNEGHFTARENEHREATDAALIESLLQ